MSETVKQSSDSQSFNTDKSNLSGNPVRKTIQMNTAALFNSYKPKESCNDFSRQSQETEQTLQKGMDI